MENCALINVKKTEGLRCFKICEKLVEMHLCNKLTIILGWNIYATVYMTVSLKFKKLNV
jgi:hypothetical protein